MGPPEATQTGGPFAAPLGPIARFASQNATGPAPTGAVETVAPHFSTPAPSRSHLSPFCSEREKGNSVAEVVVVRFYVENHIDAYGRRLYKFTAACGQIPGYPQHSRFFPPGQFCFHLSTGCPCELHRAAVEIQIREKSPEIWDFFKRTCCYLPGFRVKYGVENYLELRIVNL
jgi:hypothetical protein